jgi:hypothetical protein
MRPGWVGISTSGIQLVHKSGKMLDMLLLLKDRDVKQILSS